MSYSSSTSSFPVSLDTPTSPSGTTDTYDFDHAGLETFQNDAISKLQAKVGVDSSSVATSLDKRVAVVEAKIPAPSNSGNLMTSNGLAWTSAAPPVSVSVTAKGDLQTFSSAPAKLAVGTDGQILESRASETTGLKWVAPAVATSLPITAAPASDHTASGITIQLMAGATMAFGDVGYVASTGKVALIDADAIATMSGLVMCADASISADATGTFLLLGIARDDTWSWTVGGLIYGTVTGTTGNTLSQTAPTGTDDVVQILGVATHADRMLFNPQLVQTELV